MRSWAPIILSGLCVAALAAQDPEIRNPKTSPDDVAAGSRIYRSHCAECHSLTGEGGRGPDLTRGDFRHGSSDAALLRNIMRGIPGTEMPGIYMQDHQVWQVVAFVRSLSARPALPQTRGDPAAGEKLFRGKGGCAICHMINGSGGRQGPDLSDVGGRRSLDHLRTSLTDPNREVRRAWWFHAVTTTAGGKISGFRLNEDTYSIQMLDSSSNLRSLLKSDLAGVDVSRESTMPAYGGTLSDADLDDLVAYLASLRRK